MPQVLSWANYFLEAQGYAPERTVIYQGNKSAILLETNGKGSSSKRTKHINIRYYFIKDSIESGKVCIVHCPATVMIGDFFTKPLQRAMFLRFRNIIMNIKTRNDKHRHPTTGVCWKNIGITWQDPFCV
jgi:hypothetical protein